MTTESSATFTITSEQFAELINLRHRTATAVTNSIRAMSTLKNELADAQKELAAYDALIEQIKGQRA